MSRQSPTSQAQIGEAVNANARNHRDLLLLPCPRCRARLFGPADGSFESRFADGRFCRDHSVVNTTTDRSVAVTIRQPYAGRRVRDEPGPVLRYVRSERPTADEWAIPVD